MPPLIPSGYATISLDPAELKMILKIVTSYDGPRKRAMTKPSGVVVSSFSPISFFPTGKAGRIGRARTNGVAKHRNKRFAFDPRRSGS